MTLISGSHTYSFPLSTMCTNLQLIDLNSFYKSGVLGFFHIHVKAYGRLSNFDLVIKKVKINPETLFE